MWTTHICHQRNEQWNYDHLFLSKQIWLELTLINICFDMIFAWIVYTLRFTKCEQLRIMKWDLGRFHFASAVLYLPIPSFVPLFFAELIYHIGFLCRSSESRSDNKALIETQNEVQKSGTGVLRPFFDDWPPRSLQEPGTALSISTPGINPPSDFSLKLSTGNGDGVGQRDGNNVDRDRLQLNWAGGWGTNLAAAPMGGPLAEALRSSSTSNSSPTSVLHRLQRGSPSETSYVSTWI